MTDVFISYAREDRRFVQRLHDALAHEGRESWVDWEGIPASAKWMAEVRAAIDEADCFCFVVSPDSVESPVCREEAAHAAASNKRILPLLHREVADGLVPETVAAHNWITFPNGAEFDDAFATLVKALETEPEHLRAHTRLLVRSKEWEGSDGDRSHLLRGSDLSQAEAWLASSGGKEPAPTQGQTTYVLASRKAASRRQRTVVGAVAVALVLSLGLAAVALVQRGEATDAQVRAEERAAESRSRELAAASVGDIEVDPELSLLLAIEASGAAETPEALEALRLALAESRVRVTFTGHTGPVVVASSSPDGERILTASYDGTARIWNIDAPAEPLVLQGHTDLIEAASFSPDGSKVVTASFDGSARIWDPETGLMGLKLDGHGGAVHDAAWAPDGAMVVTAGGDGTAIVWDGATGQQLHVLSGHTRPVYDVEFSLDGSLIATASDDDTARLWDADTGRVLRILSGHTDGLYTSRFSPDGELVVTASEDGTAKVWDADSGQLVTDLIGSAGPVIDAGFSPDGGRVVTASEDGTARIWDVPSGGQRTILRGHQGELNTATFNADGSFVLTAGVDGTARVWDAANGTPVAVLHGHDGPVTAAAFSRDGRDVLTGGADGTARMWEPMSGRVVLDGGVSAAAPSPDGTKIAVATLDDRVVVLDVETGDELVNVDAGSPQIVATLTANGAYVASAGYDGVGHVWDVETGEPVTDLLGHDPAWTAPDPFSPSDRILTYSDDGTARLWDPASGAELATFDHGIVGGVGIWEAHLSADGTRVVTTGTQDGIVRMWDSATGDMLWEVDGLLSGFAGIGAAFSPAGDLVATVSGYTAIWGSETGRQVALLESPDLIRRAVFSPDGGTLATFSENGAVRTWDPRTGRLRAVMSGDADTVDFVSFSPDGRFLVANDEEGPVRVWDSMSGEAVASIGAARGAWNAFFADDGTIVSNDDRSVRVDPCDSCATPEELLKVARSRVTRTLTEEERREHLGDGSVDEIDEGPRPAGLMDAEGQPILDGLLPAGAYTAVGFEPGLRFEVPDGWYAASDIGWAGPGETQSAITVLLQRSDDPSSNLTFVHLEPGRLIDTNKDWDERRNIVPFPVNLTAWFEAQPHHAIQPQQPMTLGGVEGEVVDVELTSLPDDPVPMCGACVPTLPVELKNETGPLSNDTFYGDALGNVARWIVLQASEGTILVLVNAESRRTFKEFLPVADEVLASVQIGTRS